MELEFPAFDMVNMMQSMEVLNWQVLCTSSVLSKNGNLSKLHCWYVTIHISFITDTLKLYSENLFPIY